MKFWTVQKREVLTKIEKEGIFVPDFNKSTTVINQQVDTLAQQTRDVYDFVLGSFNDINKTECTGLVFAFCERVGDKVYFIKDIYKFHDFIVNNYNVIKSLWKSFPDDSVIMELDYDEKFNPVYIDINDFQYIMPPVITVPPYNEMSMIKIYEGLDQGVMYESDYPSNVVQAHLPYIKSENIVNLYEIFTV